MVTFKDLFPLDEPIVIAELSANHDQSLEKALKSITAAKEAGVHAVKIQTYKPDTMTLDVNKDEFLIQDPTSHWNGYNLFDLYEKAHLPWEWHQELFDHAKAIGIPLFSSPFDQTAVDFLETFEVPLYKIASYEITDIPLIDKVAQTKKPIILSTGMATLAEIEEAYNTARAYGSEIYILQCTSNYPASPTDSNLAVIPHLKQMFSCGVGLSDHTLGIGTSIASVALGGKMIEKHFTLNREDGGLDAAFSLEPEELAQLVKEVKQAYQSIGVVTYGPVTTEVGARDRRRSLYISKPLQAGEKITLDAIKSIRPGLGLSPKYKDVIVGKTLIKDVEPGVPVKWELFKS